MAVLYVEDIAMLTAGSKLLGADALPGNSEPLGAGGWGLSVASMILLNRNVVSPFDASAHL